MPHHSHMNPDLQDVLSRLNRARDSLFHRYPIRSLGVFGSIARGEARPGSDVDILVAFSAPVGLEIADLAIELETLLGRNVDLVSRKAVRESLRPYIEKDLVHV